MKKYYISYKYYSEFNESDGEWSNELDGPLDFIVAMKKYEAMKKDKDSFRKVKLLTEYEEYY